ncbi:hypothetical protein [Bradyrhizobium sp. SZCCHNS2002]|uniref:hypothetical protein n=1 Tax=Bradyrhizobium sp. SZCCHNS2002 TaxID=3057302 RepID=UPI00291619F9|nr:hypothetical protein [Bradyrhizobium sp. SZCCHNS2002]
MLSLTRIKPFGIAFAFAVMCAAGWVWALNGDFGACVTGSTDKSLQNTVAALDSTIDLGIKLAIALIGAGGALLFGLKAGVTMSINGKVSLLFAILLLGQSVLAGIFWKMQVAEDWLNKCLNLVQEDVMQRLFLASFYFFLAGLATLVFMMSATILASSQGRTPS